MKVMTALFAPTDAVRRAEELREAGASGVFTFEGPHDVFTPLVLASQVGCLDLMSNVAIAFPRNPIQLAHQAHDLQTLSEGRFILGLGTQIRAQIEKRYGTGFDRPVDRMTELVGALRAIFDTWATGERLNFRGEFYRHTLMTPTFVPPPSPYGPPPIYLGALGPRLTRAAAEVADGLLVMPFGTTRFLREHTMTNVRAGLAAAGRSEEEFEVVPEVIVSVTDDRSDDDDQMIQVVARAQPSYEQPWLQVGYFSGHMFLNLTEGTALSSGLLGNSLEQFSTSICGRVVDELVPTPPQPLPRRLGNTVRLSTFALTAGPAVRGLGEQIGEFEVPTGCDPLQAWRQLEAGMHLYCEVTLTHVRSSSRAAVAANVLESVLMRQAVAAGGTEDNGRAEASRLMAGAADVESALMLAELESVVRALAADSAATERFLGADPGAAVEAVLASADGWGVALRRFLSRHGHRGYRELCMRDASWADDPEGLGAIMQVMVRSTLERGGRASETAEVPEPESPVIRQLARWARAGARGREETKSRMALMAHSLKRGYRHLGEVLSASGRLPDADLVFFFDRPELARIVGAPGPVTGGLASHGSDGSVSASPEELVAQAVERRKALAFQDALEFPDVSVGRPTALIARPPREAAGGEIVGRPASRGTVAGVVRVARSIVDAREVQPGEILVAPVTDVGWTPYFTVIAALVTDIGSSVSHGAVVAREYGLPCVVNTIDATRTLRTGDRVRVDGDRGVVTRLEG
ncbi:TIGR03617 family F420-dependent LLM class oxidoreductase [Dietzia maris]|uniref:TIGR03617 family F420-dependent LLM class oxidoreductase n=1 Tax=Dietzia maris TaxID=37915 RepID=A0ABT8H1Q8_9ACTN|nr:TIGR03617 family F420-dependent LLM class oxidoreductase [Dietzia maris]MDN4506404.1 TIGR03617 family F420-dependent LLM class oxidoreductase [Dietzia maris]